MARSTPASIPTSSDLAIGGQAVIEGVMMRCPTAIATAVRTPGGKIIVRHKPFKGFLSGCSFNNFPLLRGGLHLSSRWLWGIGALMFSAEQAMEEDEVEERGLAKELTVWWHLVVRLRDQSAAVLLAAAGPTELTGVKSGFGFNLIDGVFRLFVFLSYS